MEIKYKITLLASLIILVGLVLVSGSIYLITQKNFVDSQYLGSALTSISDSIKQDRITSSQTDSLSFSEAAAYLRIRDEELLQIITNNSIGSEYQIPYFKIGSNYYFSKNKLNEWIDLISEKHLSF